MRKMRRSQVAIEFLMMVAIATAVIMTIIGGLYYLTSSYSEDRNIRDLKDLGYTLQNELILASEVEPGYQRTILIPDDINGADYQISQNDKYVVLSYKGTQLTFHIPPVSSGSLSKGYNTIIKDDDEVVIS